MTALSSVAMQISGTALTTGLARVVGMAALAGVLAVAGAIGYRWYAGERIQEGLAALIGLAGVAILLNTSTALGQVIGPNGGAGLFDLDAALVNVTTFLLAGLATQAGRAAGDRIALEASVVSGRRTLETDVSKFVTAVGRVVAVTVPEEIADIDGYEPVPPETKEAVAGRTFLFPRRLTVAELRDRLRDRLVDDYGIGHVDVELADDGTVEYLALGSRAAGLGPTLAPGSSAVAVRADPAYAASSGDAIELWRAGPDPTRVAVAELRAVAGEIVTIALDEAEARALDPEVRYRLLTRPVTTRIEHEFATLLRSADETMSAVTVQPGSRLDGSPSTDRRATVVAVQPDGGELEAVPPPSRPFAAGDVVYAVGPPDALRQLEAAATSPKPELSS